MDKNCPKFIFFGVNSLWMRRVFTKNAKKPAILTLFYPLFTIIARKNMKNRSEMPIYSQFYKNRTGLYLTLQPSDGLRLPPLAHDRKYTSATPASLSARAQAFAVAPVVCISSISNTRIGLPSPPLPVPPLPLQALPVPPLPSPAVLAHLFMYLSLTLKAPSSSMARSAGFNPRSFLVFFVL